MSLVKWNNQNLIPNFSFVDDLFSTPFFEQIESMQLPATNIEEKENEYTISMAVPGMQKTDIKVETDQNLLTVSAEKESEEKEGEESEGKFKRREYNYSSFRRTFTLPEFVDKDAIKATCENGELKLTLPKLMETKRQSKQIEIA
jgi:HSP20 family protein